jgi:hypothetical protein
VKISVKVIIEYKRAKTKAKRWARNHIRLSEKGKKFILDAGGGVWLVHRHIPFNLLICGERSSFTFTALTPYSPFLFIAVAPHAPFIFTTVIPILLSSLKLWPLISFQLNN